jgi:hypothetical protein
MKHQLIDVSCEAGARDRANRVADPECEAWRAPSPSSPAMNYIG